MEEGTQSKKGYNDYVFKDGRLVGQFEEMYKFSEVVPWNQDVRNFEWYTNLGFETIKAKAPYKNILDVGCGLGYFTNRMSELSSQVCGWDVSPTAIEKARKNFPSVSFDVGYISMSIKGHQAFHMVSIREVFWYVFPRLDTVVENLLSLVEPGGFLYVQQAFPAMDRPYIGKNEISSPQHLLRRFEARTSKVITLEFIKHEYKDDGPTLIALLRKNI